LSVLLIFWLGGGRAHAQTPPTLAGSWSASPLVATWQIGDWGEKCGPKPGGGGVAGGPVTITQNGSELTFAGAGRGFSTAECWEQHPGLSRISHSASARNFQNVCKTAAADPRQAKIVTTISATDSRINFDETGQYQFVIEGQNCTASVRRTRSYSLVLRQGDKAPSTPSATAPTPKPAARAARDCENAGLPERLEVRPSRKLMRPGESFNFRTAVLDARGCALPVTPSWTVLGASTALSVTAPGSVVAAPGATESEITIEVTLGDRSVRVIVEIAAKDRYDALLQARGLDESGESKDAAVLRVASESLGAREVVARDDSKSKTRWFVALAGALALLLGVTGFVLVRRSRRAAQAEAVEAPSRPLPVPGTAVKVCPTCREEFPPHAEFCDKDGNRLVPQSALAAGPGGSVCPVCGRGFNPGTLICPEHNEELIPAAAYAARAAAPPPTQSICPMCGATFTGDIRFCGECGAGLVPIN
jgi:hypothetical protein